MLISEYIHPVKLQDHISKGNVRVSKHPKLPLAILCYTKKAHFGNIWDDVTEKCRGIVYNTETNEIVARPFEKSFNYETSFKAETRQSNLPKEQPIITDKVNGCLAVLWRIGHHWGISSKGSFTSAYAVKATEIMQNHIEQFGRSIWPQGHTPVFELTCESLHMHAVHYPHEELHLLALINTATGEELPPEKVQYYAAINGLKCVRFYDITVDKALKDDEPNREGYMLSWPRPGKSPFKVKVKFKNFLRNNNTLRKIDRKQFIEWGKQGRKDLIDALVADRTIPEHIHQKAVGLLVELTTERVTISARAKGIVLAALEMYTERKDYANFFNRPENKQYADICFAIIDQDEKRAKELTWQLMSQQSQ